MQRTWLIIIIGVFFACSDSETLPIEVPDAQPPPDVPPFMCFVLPCTVLPTEGGQLRVESIQTGYDAETGSHTVDPRAWFVAFTNQTPGSRLPLGLEVDGAASCHDMTQDSYLLNGRTPEEQAIADTRDYYTAGTSITLTSDSSQILLDKREDQADPSEGLVHDIIYVADAPSVAPGVKYSLPYLPPYGYFPGLDLYSGGDTFGGSQYVEFGAAHVPEDYMMSVPAEAEFFAGLALVREQDMTLEWTPEQEQPVDWPTLYGAVMFFGQDGKLYYLCLEPMVTQMTIPGALFDAPSFPQAGTLVHGMLTHTTWFLPTGQMFYILGMNGKTTTFTLLNP